MMTIEATGDAAKDTAAIKAAVAGIPIAQSRRTYRVRLVGPLKIDDTITAERVSVAFEGDGADVTWHGPAGKPMFRLIDCTQCRFEGLNIVGNPDAPPSAAIQFVSRLGWTASTRHAIRDVRIGESLVSNPADVWFENGIVVGGGDNADNDQSVIDNVFVGRCRGVGIDLQDTQNVLWTMPLVSVQRCGIGIRTAARTTSIGTGNYAYCGVDLKLLKGSSVTEVHHHSEHCGRMIEGEKCEYRLLGGGRWLIRKPQDGPVIDHVKGHGVYDLAGMVFERPGLTFRFDARLVGKTPDALTVRFRDCANVTRGQIEVTGGGSPTVEIDGYEVDPAVDSGRFVRPLPTVRDN